jgi:hypothetical protein
MTNRVAWSGCAFVMLLAGCGTEVVSGNEEPAGRVSSALNTACAGPTLSSPQSSPQNAGTSVTLNATSTACSSPLYQYWMLPPGGSWTVLQPWTTSATFAWDTTGLSDGGYQLEVWVKDAGSSTGSYDTAAVLGFTIGAAGAPCATATLSSPQSSPQTAGTSVTLNASSTACSSPQYEYWMLSPGGTYTLLRSWTTSTSFAWNTSGLSNGAYQLEIWAKDASSSTTSYDTDAVLDFTIGAAGTPCTAGTLSSPQSSPQAAGTSVTLNAGSAACGSPMYQYWVLPPGGSWTVLQPWTTSASYAWNTSMLSDGGYQLEVWVKDASSPTTSYDTAAVLGFTIGAAGTPCATATLSSPQSSPQSVGTSVTLNASSTACGNPLYQYWMLSPGGTYTLLQSWTTSTSFAWNTSSLSSGAYQLEIWAKDASSSTTSYDTDAVLDFTIATAGTPCTTATLSSPQSSPQTAGTSVTLNAGSGACGSPMYQYWVLPPGGSWTVLQPWTTSTSYAWNTSMLSDGGYQLEVWVKDAGSTTSSYDTAAVLGFTIGAAGTPCATATLSSPQSSPQAAGTPVTLNASSTACASPLYAYWMLSPGGTYTQLQSWTTSTSFAWDTSSLPNGAYQLEIWAKDASSSTTSYDTDAVLDFTIAPGTGSDGGAGSDAGADAADSGTDASADAGSVLGCGRFASGYTGSWTTVAANPFSYGMGMVGYLPAGGGATTYLINEATAVMDAYTASTNTYSALAGLGSAYYRGPAWSNGALWSADSGNLYKYTFANNTWTMAASGVLTANDAQTAADDSSNIWGYRTDGTLLEYRIGTGTVTTHALPAALQNFTGPRITWDSCSGLLYLTNATATAMYSYNPTTGVTTTLSGLPTAFDTGFCGDRSGHIFAFASTSSNLWKGVWQYTIATATWALTSSGPTASASSACGVGADGFLYATDPNVSSAMYRIKLQ